MRILAHHIYEFEKGLRDLVLHTMAASEEAQALARLSQRGISHHLERVGANKINLFFGDPQCVAIVQRLCHKPLHALTPEEDFILGTMLGYSRMVQCSRYLKRRDLPKGGCLAEAACRAS